MKEEKEHFNPAFKNLQEKMRDTRKHMKASDPGQPPESEKRLDGCRFLEAMTDVTPLPAEKKKITRNPGPNVKPAHAAPDDEREAMKHLHRILKGSVEIDITFSDEYIEGSVTGFSRKIMKRLKKGQYPVQDHIDLHGLTKQEAERAVKDFLIRNWKLGRRCVLIVHGRGLNSPDSFPVIKEGLPKWLSRGPVKKMVLAFATARPYDGGTGAVYVLLRKR